MWLREELAALDPREGDLRRFGFVFGGAVLALAALAWYKSSPALPYMVAAGALAVALGAALPRSLRGFYYLWMAVGLILGRIVTAIILTVVFVVAITPIGLFMRLLGKDPMNRRLDPDAESYWLPKTHAIEDESRFDKYF